MKPTRVLLVQPTLQPPGGGSGVAAWMIQALHETYELSLLTLAPFDAAEVNRFYGTSIDPSRVRAMRAFPRLSPWLGKLKWQLRLLKRSLLFRHLYRISPDYDLLISAHNEADLHRRGIQYVHFPGNHLPRPQPQSRPFHHRQLIARYRWVCARIAPVTHEGVLRNLSLVNSDWTGRNMEHCYPGGAVRTLYPPVAGAFPDVPWIDRENGFVCIGRLSHEKELDRVLDIVGAVRERFEDVRLHLIGTRDGRGYDARVLTRALEQRWVTFHENLGRDDLARLVARQRFGIHAMREEHFGMAVGEMVRAGCVVWVPRGGGQMEIVRDPRLWYGEVGEATAKIVAAMADEREIESLLDALLPQRSAFTEEVFTRRFLQFVEEHLAAMAPASAR